MPIESQPATSKPILTAVLGKDFDSTLAHAQAGDEDAFVKLWHDVNPALLRYLQVLAGPAVEDVTAETWITVIKGLARFQGSEIAWRAWIFTTARRRAIDEGRRRKRQLAVQATHAAATMPSPQFGPDPAQVVLEHMNTDAALALIAQLAPLQAEVIVLRTIAGLDVEHVARLLGRSPGAVRVAAHRGLARLAHIVTAQGVTL